MIDTKEIVRTMNKQHKYLLKQINRLDARVNSLVILNDLEHKSCPKCGRDCLPGVKHIRGNNGEWVANMVTVDSLMETY